MNWLAFALDIGSAFCWIGCGWMARVLYQDYLDDKSELSKVWKPLNRPQ